MLSSRERLQKPREATGGRRAVRLAAGRTVVSHEASDRAGSSVDWSAGGLTPRAVLTVPGAGPFYTGGLYFRQKLVGFLVALCGLRFHLSMNGPVCI